MAANVSGAVLAALFHEHTNSPGDQEGFLLGQIVSHVKDTITDSQMSGLKVETVTNVYSFIPCLYSGTFYDRNGDIIKQKLDSLLQGRTKELVGWYRFRRNSSARVSMKENCLHRKLLKLVEPAQHQHFLFCLSTSSTTTNISTHSFDHCFQVLLNSCFRPVPLSVINLGYSMQEEYKHKANMAVNPSSGVYHSLISKFVPEFSDEAGEMFQVKKMHSLADKLQSQLQLLCNVVNKSERDLQALENELTDIRREVDRKRELQRPKQPLPPTPGDPPQDYLPMDTEGPPPYPGHDKPPAWEPLFIQSRDKKELREERQMKSEFLPADSVHVPLVSIDIENVHPVDNSRATKLPHEEIFLDDSPSSSVTETTNTAPDMLLSDIPLQPQKHTGATLKQKSQAKRNNSDSKTSSQLERTNSLPNKTKQGETSSDHFSFIDTVVQQAKSTTPSRSESVRAPAGRNRNAHSLDEPVKTSQRDNRALVKPARTFESGSNSEENKSVDRNLNNNTVSSLSYLDAGPSTIDRHDRLRCKPVQRTRSRAQAYVRSKSSENSIVQDCSVADADAGSAENATVAHIVDGHVSATAPINVGSSSDTASISDTAESREPIKTKPGTKKSRTRAQVQAERAAAAKLAVGVRCSDEAHANPPTILGAASGSVSSSGNENEHEGTSDAQSPNPPPEVGELRDIEQLQCIKGSSSPVF